MLGKIIAHGATRVRAGYCVEDCVLLGVPTNQRLLASLLKHPHFIAGDFSTALLPNTQRHPAYPSRPTKSWPWPPRCFTSNTAPALTPSHIRLAQQRQRTSWASWHCRTRAPTISLSVLADSCLHVEIDQHAIVIRDLLHRRTLATAVLNGIVPSHCSPNSQGTRLCCPA